MASWDNKTKKIIHYPPRICEHNPNWEVLDCGCCSGLQWGGEEPRECDNCMGTGVEYRHIKSRVLALYPGGPFLGKETLWTSILLK